MSEAVAFGEHIAAACGMNAAAGGANQLANAAGGGANQLAPPACDAESGGLSVCRCGCGGGVVVLYFALIALAF